MFVINFLLKKIESAGELIVSRTKSGHNKKTSVKRIAIVFASILSIASAGIILPSAISIKTAAAERNSSKPQPSPKSKNQKAKNKQQNSKITEKAQENLNNPVPVGQSRVSTEAEESGRYPLDMEKGIRGKLISKTELPDLSKNESVAREENEENDGNELFASSPRNSQRFNVQKNVRLVNLMDFSERYQLLGENNLAVDEEEAENDPDMTSKGSRLNKEVYIRMRGDYISQLRGIDPDNPFSLNPNLRAKAIELENQKLSRTRNSPAAVPGAWTNIGPAPIPNGQLQSGGTAPVSGRSTMVVVDPTDSNKVYLATAQGGVWRSLDGGATWVAIFDSAQSLAVGAIALAPSDPTILYVGTGEGNNSADSFFGAGVYRIDNAPTTATLVGPINPLITTGTTTAITYNCFTGRSITKILVSPTDPATIFVSTATGVGGVSGTSLSNTVPPIALRGVFRSTNATSAPASVTFQKLAVTTDGSLDAPGTGNTSVFDMVFEPGTPNNLLVTTQGASIGGKVWRSTDALAASPTFTATLAPGFNGLVMKLAINKVGTTVTAYVASNEPTTAGSTCANAGNSGRVRKSTDGGVTWSTPLAAAEGYCGGQCSYDNPIAVNPNDANNVYIGGNARGTCSAVLKRSADGGTTFTRDDTGLHADSHYIFFDAQTPTPTVWFANDGGIWKRPDATAGTAWLNQNNSPLSITQFQSLAVHPTDRNYTIGGTQDNGTEAQPTTSGTWVSAEGGDGGFSLIDQSSTDTVNVTMYHTFYNVANSQILFDRANLSACLTIKNSWSTRGPFVTSANVVSADDNSANTFCDGTPNYIGSNGIQISDNVLFYAPMALGPGTPNVLYFGTDRLYRSTNKGDLMNIVSQSPINPTSTRVPAGGTTALSVGTPISAIGISPQDDNARIVGLQNGQVWFTLTGSSTLTNASFTPPANANGSTTNLFVSRAVFDPANVNTAYITLSYYTNPAAAGHVFKTTNLNAATPTWTSISGTGAGALPNIPINAFAVDRNDPTQPGVSVLYAGTDIGVYSSTNNGTDWIPYGSGLPRVAVFDMAIQPTNRVLRIATHGRGMWEIGLPLAVTAGEVTVGGRVSTTGGRGILGAIVSITDQNGNVRTAMSGTFGYYRFANVAVGGSYTFSVKAKRFTFEQSSQLLNINGETNEINFTGNNR